MSLLDGEIRDGRHHMQVRVYYEDTDSRGQHYQSTATQRLPSSFCAMGTDSDPESRL
jgi:hypothetical protein